jgi:hypothetical protein
MLLAVDARIPIRVKTAFIHMKIISKHHTVPKIPFHTLPLDEDTSAYDRLPIIQVACRDESWGAFKAISLQTKVSAQSPLKIDNFSYYMIICKTRLRL